MDDRPLYDWKHFGAFFPVHSVLVHIDLQDPIKLKPYRPKGGFMLCGHELDQGCLTGPEGHIQKYQLLTTESETARNHRTESILMHDACKVN